MHRETQPHVLVAGGACGVALTTAAEVLTAPYSPHVRFYSLNGGVHVLKVVAALAFVAGLVLLVRRDHVRLGRLGSVAALALATGTTVAAIPYSVAEAVNPERSPAAAAAWLDAGYENAFAWVSALANAGLPLVLLGIVGLAIAVLRRHLLPRWRPVLTLVAIPAAVVAGVLNEGGLPVPHPPAWLFAALATAYSARFAHLSAARRRAVAEHAPA
jgi:hypothetical protein